MNQRFERRRILNLNQPSWGFIRIISFFLLLIPGVLSLILLLWKETEQIRLLLYGLLRISFAIGVLVLGVFLLLILAEQIQDHWIDVQYRRNRDRKLPLTHGNYECQYCGNRNVKESDSICSVCGRTLRLQ